MEKIILKNGFQTSALDTWEYLRFWQACIIEFWKSLFESRRIFFIFWKSFQSYYCRNNVIDNVPLARLLLSPFCSIYSKPFFIFVICFIFHIPSPPPPLFFVHHWTLPNCDFVKITWNSISHLLCRKFSKRDFSPLYLEVFFTIINDFVLLITDESLANRPNQIHQDDLASRVDFSCKNHWQKSTFFVFVLKLKTCGILAKLDPPHTNSPRWLLSLDRGSSSMSFLQPKTSPCFTYIKRHGNIVDYHAKRFFIHCPNRLFFPPKNWL